MALFYTLTGKARGSLISILGGERASPSLGKVIIGSSSSSDLIEKFLTGIEASGGLVSATLWNLALKSFLVVSLLICF